MKLELFLSTNEIKKVTDWAFIPIIFLTARAREEDKIEVALQENTMESFENMEDRNNENDGTEGSNTNQPSNDRDRDSLFDELYGEENDSVEPSVKENNDNEEAEEVAKDESEDSEQDAVPDNVRSGLGEAERAERTRMIYRDLRELQRGVANRMESLTRMVDDSLFKIRMSLQELSN